MISRSRLDPTSQIIPQRIGKERILRIVTAICRAGSFGLLCGAAVCGHAQFLDRKYDLGPADQSVAPGYQAASPISDSWGSTPDASRSFYYTDIFTDFDAARRDTYRIDDSLMEGGETSLSIRREGEMGEVVYRFTFSSALESLTL